MDLGCYSLHAHRMLAPWAGGPPRVVAARDGERAGHPGVDEWLEADLEFPGGATGGARCSMAGEEVRMTCRIVGDRGEATAANFALATMELIDACYRAAGFPPRPRSRREQAPRCRSMAGGGLATTRVGSGLVSLSTLACISTGLLERTSHEGLRLRAVRAAGDPPDGRGRRASARRR